MRFVKYLKFGTVMSVFYINNATPGEKARYSISDILHLSFKGAPKLYFMHYPRDHYFWQTMNLSKSVFYTSYFGKILFPLHAFSAFFFFSALCFKFEVIFTYRLNNICNDCFYKCQYFCDFVLTLINENLKIVL